MNSFDWQDLDRLAAEHGSSFFLFDEEAFQANFTAFRDAFRRHYPRMSVAYSYKTNYTPALCRLVDDMGGYAEVVSSMEYGLAERLGVSGRRIVYNGPYKSSGSIRRALLAGAIVNIDSPRDHANVMETAASHPEQTFAVGIRCNFDLGDYGPSRFGMDVDGEDFAASVADLEGVRNTRLAGLHCHYPYRDLASYRLRAKRMVDTARRVFGDTPPDFLNLGGGFFGGMPLELQERLGVEPVAFDEYGSLVGGILRAEFGADAKAPELIVEPGTALVADTFRFATRVISTKTIRGRGMATVAGSRFNMNMTAPSIDLPVRAFHDPDATPARAAGPTSFDVGGFTCVEGDILTKGLAEPLAVGDFLVYENVGSYSVVMKPPFILPDVPILRTRPDSSGTHSFDVIRKAQTVDQVFETFVW